ncbi:hypothetical protein BKA65DRAFT_483268 [Rhexocercosporidium sp. MPI-PUGE-AT-0058]|nr:hypothetical protein BKA65DRAFT_483268 [Rhexocercosporidium sp. MPI-PUGE-AT-0058]
MTIAHQARILRWSVQMLRMVSSNKLQRNSSPQKGNKREKVPPAHTSGMAPSTPNTASTPRSRTPNSLHRVNKTKTHAQRKIDLRILKLAQQYIRRGTRSDPIDVDVLMDDVETLFPRYEGDSRARLTCNSGGVDVIELDDKAEIEIVVKRVVSDDEDENEVEDEVEEDSLFVTRENTPEESEEESPFVTRASTPEEESLFVTRDSTPQADNNSTLEEVSDEDEEGADQVIIPIPLHSTPPISQSESAFLTTFPTEIHLQIMDHLQHIRHTITLLPGAEHTHPLISLSRTSRILYHTFHTWLRQQPLREYTLHPRFGLFIPRLTVFKICWIGDIEGRNCDQRVDQMFQRIYSPAMAARHLQCLEIWQVGMNATSSIHHSLINLIVPPQSPYSIRPAQHEADSPSSGVYDFPVLDVRYARHDEDWEERVRKEKMDVLMGLPVRIWTRDLETYSERQEVVLSHPCSSGVMERRNEEECGRLDPKPFFGWEGSFMFRN